MKGNVLGVIFFLVSVSCFLSPIFGVSYENFVFLFGVFVGCAFSSLIYIINCIHWRKLFSLYKSKFFKF